MFCWIFRDIKDGKVSAGGDADGAYTEWKKGKYLEEVERFAKKWGADAETLQASVNEYDETVPENIPGLTNCRKALIMKVPKKSTAICSLTIGSTLQQSCRDG